MRRVLEPEILDSLPVDHPEARRNRRDLALINRITGNFGWLADTIPLLARPGEPVLEIGAGTGDLSRRLHGLGVAADGLDLWPRPADWPEARAWRTADLREFDGFDGYPILVANLILHQFSAPELAVIGRRAGRAARAIVACEPARLRRSQLLFAAVSPFFGANYVTRHDARVSIAAGFIGGELPELLGLERDRWECRCSITPLGVYRMLAIRRP